MQIVIHTKNYKMGNWYTYEEVASYLAEKAIPEYTEMLETYLMLLRL